MTTGRVADPLIGRLLDGRYRIDHRIARGGMATVFQGLDLRLDRPVAIKVMHAGLGDDDEFARRFQREARAAARLSHPNVVAVFDQGDDDGTLYLVMELVPGLTLRDVIRKNAPLEPSKALGIVGPVLAALAAAHRAGMIHRDVKPENVLLGDDGSVKVADFGLARAINAETQHTGTAGVLIGTVSYLSPELVVNGQTDARTDVYAVGVILFELLTGEKPHQAETPIQVAYKHVHEDIPAPSTLVRGIPPAVDALVARATARDLYQRPADASELLADVRRVRQALGTGAEARLARELAPEHGPVDTLTDTPRPVIDPSAHPDDFAGQPHWPTDEGETVSIAAAARRAPTAGVDGHYAATPDGGRGDSRGRRKLLMAAAIALLLVVAGWYFGIYRYTTTPGLVSMTTSQANTRAHQSGLALHVAGTGWSETIPKGEVMRTDPATGDRILKDGTVSVWLSRGPERHDVPAVAGRGVDQAQRMLQRSRLSFGQRIDRWSPSVPQGTVISSAPAVGTTLRRGTAVDLIVSKGPKPIAIPDFTDQSGPRARQRLHQLGFQVDVTTTYSDAVDAGMVISQSPPNGTGHAGDTISLTISRGPHLVTVPQVRGMGVSAATQELEARGFQVTTTQGQLYLGLGYVSSSDPAAGTAIPRGSTITLYLV